MLGVATIWNETFATGLGQKRWYNLYKQTAKAFGATHLLWVEDRFTTPEIVDQEITAETYQTFGDVRTQYQNVTFVFLDPSSNLMLYDYTHPVGDTIYVVGTDESGLSGLDKEVGEDLVSICGVLELWSPIALGIALHDRFAKSS